MTDKVVSFERTKEENALITAVVLRAADSLGLAKNHWDLHMDLCAAHANGCPIDFQKLLDADDATFGHDVLGVRKYINRQTGELEECFVPRCAKREKR